MSSVHEFSEGDYLIFQLEAGFGLLRVLDVEEDDGGDTVWHIAAYQDLFLDAEMADAAIEEGRIAVAIPHVALTDRAFGSTQVAMMRNMPLQPTELSGYEAWKASGERKISDRSIRLLLGLR